MFKTIHKTDLTSKIHNKTEWIVNWPRHAANFLIFHLTIIRKRWMAERVHNPVKRIVIRALIPAMTTPTHPL